MKLKSNILYKVTYKWGEETKFGVGFAYNLDKDERPHIGISLPTGGVSNIAADEAVSIEEYKTDKNSKWIEITKENILKYDNHNVLMYFVNSRNGGEHYANIEGIIKVVQDDFDGFPIYDFITNINIPTEMSNTKFKLIK